MNEMSSVPAVSPPPHVPPALVYDFDLHLDPGLARDPHERILEIIRESPPIFWTSYQGGMWVLRTHAAVYKASRDWETFSNDHMDVAQTRAMVQARAAGQLSIPLPVPILLDPPLHTAFRAPLQTVFAPKAVMALRDKIRNLAVELLEAIKPEGACEFMHDVAEPLPVKVFLDLLGLPSERYPEYRALAAEHMRHTGGPPEETMERLRRVADAMKPTILERMESPRDDIISLLLATEIEGRKTTLEDLENYGVLLFIAGLDTVMNGMGFGVRHLAMHPELQHELRDNPKLIPEAGEELLRRYSFTTPPRFIRRDTVFEGIEMKAGERALLFLPAADLDGAEFPEPEAYDLDRENNVHIAFGVGPHRCLGSHLARIEMQILYEELLARIPEFRLDPERPPSFHGGNVIGVDSLHLKWDA